MRVCRRLSLRMAAVGLVCCGWMCGANPARSAGLDAEAIRKAAVGAKSRFLGEAERVQAVELFHFYLAILPPNDDGRIGQIDNLLLLQRQELIAQLHRATFTIKCQYY